MKCRVCNAPLRGWTIAGGFCDPCEQRRRGAAKRPQRAEKAPARV